MEKTEKSDLKLVFDTCALLQPAGLAIFQDIAEGKLYTLPTSVLLMIPHKVDEELERLQCDKNKEKPKKNSKKTWKQAKKAYEYLEQFKQQRRCVRLQSKSSADYLRNVFYPPKHGPYRSPCDGAILVYALYLLHNTDTGVVWLITEDKELQARAARSGLVAMSARVLREAVQLPQYSGLQPDGGDYHTWFSEKCRCVSNSMAHGDAVKFGKENFDRLIQERSALPRTRRKPVASSTSTMALQQQGTRKESSKSAMGMSQTHCQMTMSRQWRLVRNSRLLLGEVYPLTRTQAQKQSKGFHSLQ
ncbi:uncharacterized protein LOC129602677 [Paramacrobiotus metropolitanus]|uniref:uncharacterized protein LOC129602677 n=1 Tax=Paramacrobiotus metropolitanus TaxID=2943436 RepID=UPI002446381E|nr:uncharacterized protein LOC129602677 [Paramacrobiotus metropolitanus]